METRCNVFTVRVTNTHTHTHTHTLNYNWLTCAPILHIKRSRVVNPILSKTESWVTLSMGIFPRTCGLGFAELFRQMIQPRSDSFPVPNNMAGGGVVQLSNIQKQWQNGGLDLISWYFTPYHQVNVNPIMGGDAEGSWILQEFVPFSISLRTSWYIEPITFSCFNLSCSYLQWLSLEFHETWCQSLGQQALLIE